MKKFSMRVAAALVTCAALSLGACLGEDDKSASKPSEPEAPATANAPAAAPESAPAPAAEPEKAAEAPAPAAEPEKPAEAAAPAAEPEKTAEAAAPAAEPEKPAEAAAPAAEPEKPAEAAAPAAEPEKAAEAPAPAAEPEKPAEAAAPAAEPEKPAEAAAPAAGGMPAGVAPNPVHDLAATLPDVEWKDGRYRIKETGAPTPVVTKDYMVDWATWEGFRRYHDACHVCHGPNALGSTFAPGLADSLKTMDYETFFGIVVGGRVTQRGGGGTTYVMPAFGEDKNIMCYLDDIYTYIKARSINAASEGKEGMPAGRPNGREDKSEEAKKSVTECENG